MTLTENRKYYQLNDTLANVYLEDSYVLDIQEVGGLITFLLEIVLTEKHSLYTKPLANEQYCYKQGTLTFPNTESYNLVRSNTQPSKDPDGSIDYGNLDEFYINNDSYTLSGEWGVLSIKSDSPIITLD